MANHDWGKQLDKVAKSLPKIVEDVFNNALLSQQPVAIETIARLRRLNPEYTPEQLIKDDQQNLYQLSNCLWCSSRHSSRGTEWRCSSSCSTCRLSSLFRIIRYYTF